MTQSAPGLPTASRTWNRGKWKKLAWSAIGELGTGEMTVVTNALEQFDPSGSISLSNVQAHDFVTRTNFGEPQSSIG
jgi:hypothetical protein